MKCYIYVTKSKQYLWKYHCVSDNFNGIGFETSYSKEEHDSTDDGEILNGQIAASFDLNKIEKIFNTYEYRTISMPNFDILSKSCLTFNQLNDYLKEKSGYAWYINNLQILDKPKNITSFCTRDVIDKYGIISCSMIMKAPQSWCYAKDIEGNNCIIISIKPEWACKIFNGEKTIEIRKTKPNLIWF